MILNINLNLDRNMNTNLIMKEDITDQIWRLRSDEHDKLS